MYGGNDIMIELKDSLQQLNFISDDLRAIRSAALMADENKDWNMEGDVVRLIALAVEPIMNNLNEVIVKLDNITRSKNEEDLHEA